MALPAALTRPFRLQGADLEPRLVLLCRLLALTLLFTWHVQYLQTPFLSFVPFLEELPGVAFQRTLQVTVVAGSLAMLFGARIRLAAFLTGAALLLAVLSSRTYFGNNKTFTALLLLLAAVGDARLLRWQVAILYFGAGLNKAFDPDWHSGQFFDHWAAERLRNAFYLWAAPLLPPLVLGKLFCGMTIAVELALAGLMLFRRWAWPAVWISALFQCGLVLFTGQTFTLFFFASQIALLAFVEWPKEPITVIWDGECGFCAQARDRISQFDPDGLFNWVAQQTGIGQRWGLSREALANAMYTVSGERIRSGYAAFRAMIVWLPAFWYAALAAAVLAPRPAVLLLLLFLTPLSNPIGESVYRWVARNRHRFGDQTCAVPPGPRRS
jgi:predicted DCC family thiol-disulfide oxidoreductase YuxK